MTVLRRVGVLSVGKILAAVYGFMGLLIGGVLSLMSIAGAAGSLASNRGGQGFVALFGVAAIIFFPLLYGLIGFISGLIFALVYNAAASAMGGIELELGPARPIGFQVQMPERPM